VLPVKRLRERTVPEALLLRRGRPSSALAREEARGGTFSPWEKVGGRKRGGDDMSSIDLCPATPHAPHRLRTLRVLLAGLAMVAASIATAAASCLPVARDDGRGLLLPASFDGGALIAALPAVGSVELTYLGHSSFLIVSPGGATAVTDYNGVHRAPFAPDIVTMNNAHSTHFTDYVEPGVKHVLRGWPTGSATMAVHDLTYLDMRVRNVPTNARDWEGGTRVAGNSIFVFEVAGLCIAHLGHLHHRLEAVHLAELGPIDVLLVPVDGSYTLAQPLIAEVIDQVGPRLVIPMHVFSEQRLAQFLALIEERYPVEWSAGPTAVLARESLPQRGTLVLPGR
jgi:L-ascorbate metabolism protein UlaG (beta-lactamase superfamily)